eukprot:Plantae.Rhodophyta-Rhodochaete_pulchella.ctg56.p1 GENE.Plantae.Rhodophyta-Rhodochaete_pulchella.ctg56~~Plantae.Rhodophyta-Rhodochaete_pulchella.ctg56.p1  ORF type:complete len:305 (+),score=37.69 Plantae.Rhodophyta-Rhodochaete_pulchella.ctg56:327-1241(+)
MKQPKSLHKDVSGVLPVPATGASKSFAKHRSKLAALALVLVVYLVVQASGDSKTSTIYTNFAASHFQHSRPPRRFIVDIGANSGNSYHDLASKYWMGNTLHGDMGDYEVFLVEPNPRFEPYLRRLVAAEHSRVGKEFITYMPVAASTSNGTVSFFVDPSLPLAGKYTDDDGYGSGGSSLLGGMPAVDPKNPKNPNINQKLVKEGADANVITVQAIDVVDWLDKLFEPQDEAHLKIDVEGMEYELLKRLMPRGVLCKVDHLYIEFHGRSMRQSTNTTLHQYADYDAALVWLLGGCPRPPVFHPWA